MGKGIVGLTLTAGFAVLAIVAWDGRILDACSQPTWSVLFALAAIVIILTGVTSPPTGWELFFLVIVLMLIAVADAKLDTRIMESIFPPGIEINGQCVIP